MRPVDDIEALIQKIDVTPDAEADQRTLADILEAQEKSSKAASVDLQQSTWRLIMKSRITRYAAAAVILVVACLVLNIIGGPDVATVAWGNVLENVEQIESFVFQHQISITSAADGTVIQEAETTTYVSSEFGLRQDAYVNGEVIGTSYMPMTGTSVTQIMPGEKKYRIVTMREEDIRRTHEQVNPKGMIRELLSFEHTQLGRQIIDGVEVEGFEVNDPDFLTRVFESTVGRLWVDVETNMPVRTEIEGISGDGSIKTTIVASEFDWDAEPGPSVFEPHIPDDYTVFGK